MLELKSRFVTDPVDVMTTVMTMCGCSGSTSTWRTVAVSTAGADTSASRRVSSDSMSVVDWSAKLHVVPACVIGTTCPATVRSVVRGVVEPPFDVMVTDNDPLPVPDTGESVAQGAVLLATQEQFAPLAVMPLEPTFPAAGPYGLPRFVVSIVTLHAKQSCVTRNN